MRIAAISDIHGNITALEAVLDDVLRSSGVDEYWFLGDLVAIGPSPVQVLETISALENVRCVRGNTDRYVAGIRANWAPWPAFRPPLSKIQHITPRPALDRETFAWTKDKLSRAGWLDWLANLPMEIRQTLPDGTRALCLHASPGRDDGPGLRYGLSDDEMRALLGECKADLVIGGHTHRPMDREVDGLRLINIGSVSNPPDGDYRASYVIIDAGAGGYTINHKRVEYDRREVLSALAKSGCPSANHIISHLHPNDI